VETCRRSIRLGLLPHVRTKTLARPKAVPGIAWRLHNVTRHSRIHLGCYPAGATHPGMRSRSGHPDITVPARRVERPPSEAVDSHSASLLLAGDGARCDREEGVGPTVSKSSEAHAIPNALQIAGCLDAPAPPCFTRIEWYACREVVNIPLTEAPFSSGAHLLERGPIDATP
jgi:hypothetical protein